MSSSAQGEVLTETLIPTADAVLSDELRCNTGCGEGHDARAPQASVVDLDPVDRCQPAAKRFAEVPHSSGDGFQPEPERVLDRHPEAELRGDRCLELGEAGRAGSQLVTARVEPSGGRLADARGTEPLGEGLAL